MLMQRVGFIIGAWCVACIQWSRCTELHDLQVLHTALSIFIYTACFRYLYGVGTKGPEILKYLLFIIIGCHFQFLKLFISRFNSDCQAFSLELESW